MDFFESLPEPPPPPSPVRPVWMKPAAALPAGLAENAILVRDEQIAVSIGSLSVYPNGFEFFMHIRSRGDADTANPFGHRRYADYIKDSDEGAPDPSQALRLGIQFADGRRTASTRPSSHSPGVHREPGELVMLPGAGGGGGRFWDLSYWIHPLPPQGPVTIVVSWLAQGITEVRHDMDGAGILAAAEQAVQLWPEEPLGGWIGSQP